MTPQKRIPDALVREITEWQDRLASDPKQLHTPECVAWVLAFMDNHSEILLSKAYTDHYNELSHRKRQIEA